VSFHLMKEYSSLWYFRHSKAFPRFQTKRYGSCPNLVKQHIDGLFRLAL
jgi:hypothetical protein